MSPIIVHRFNACFSASDTFYAKRLGLVRATVCYDGNVSLNIPVFLQTICKIDVQNYPMDHQKCDMVFGSWGHHAEQIKVKSLVRVQLGTFSTTCY